MAKMKQTRPSVILLDLEVPRMDGLIFLRKLMAEDPIPLITCSSAARARTGSRREPPRREACPASTTGC